MTTIRQKREEIGFSQARMAAALGMNRRQIHRWEHAQAPVPRWYPILLALWTHQALPQGLRDWLDQQPKPQPPATF